MEVNCQTKDKALEITVPIMLVFYVVLLSALLHNSIRFIFLKAQLRNLHVYYFYILVFVTVILRIIFMILILQVAIYESCEKWDHYSDIKKAIEIIDRLATYGELLIGVQQASSMTELYLFI